MNTDKAWIYYNSPRICPQAQPFLLESGTISDIQQAFSILHVKKELQPKILKILNLN